MYVKLIRAQLLNIHTTENLFLYDFRPYREKKDITDNTAIKAIQKQLHTSSNPF